MRCGDSSQKEQILQQVLSSLNLNYSADIEAFEQFVRSDHVIDSIRTLEGRIKFFETAIKKDPSSPYVLQHYARMLHRSGHSESSLAQIEKALELRPNARVLFHTQGTILSKLAEDTDSVDVSRRRLVQAEQAFRKAIKIYPRDEYSYSSLARLYLAWAKKTPDESPEYLTKCEATISEGMQVVIAKESLWLVSSEVQAWVGNEPARLRFLEKAVQEQPAATLPRYLLARAYRMSGKPSEAMEVLKPVIRENINEFRLCIEYALCLDTLGKPYSEAVAILSLGTTYGLSDSRFIATYGGMLFMAQRFSDADRIFEETGKRDFASSEANTVQFRPRARDKINNTLELEGRVSGVKAGYAFIEVPGYARFFCPSSKQQGVVLQTGMQVGFKVGFSARGAQASEPFAVNLEKIQLSQETADRLKDFAA
jgi:tetratricopeptide (TPR) repeat protein